jgi:hypothetical protein
MPCRPALLVLLLASALRASEAPESMVQEKLLTPLAARDAARSRYSRGEAPAAERRLRLETARTADAKGGAFIGFAVDARYGFGEGRWRPNVIGGCVYLESGDVYVRYGDGYREAGVLLGKKAAPAASHVCRAAGAGA